jgi:plasmid maintenance system antidote protein VapI
MDALRAYMNKKKWTATRLAVALEIDLSTVTRLLNGQRGPSLGMALLIEEKTCGAVPIRSWSNSKHAA